MLSHLVEAPSSLLKFGPISVSCQAHHIPCFYILSSSLAKTIQRIIYYFIYVSFASGCGRYFPHLPQLNLAEVCVSVLIWPNLCHCHLSCCPAFDLLSMLTRAASLCKRWNGCSLATWAKQVPRQWSLTSLASPRNCTSHAHREKNIKEENKQLAWERLPPITNNRCETWSTQKGSLAEHMFTS